MVNRAEPVQNNKLATQIAIMDALAVDTTRLIVRLCSSNLGAEELLARINGSKGKNIVAQLFDYGAVINSTHLLGAYLNAVTAMDSGTCISNSVSMEMLLFAAMTKQISDAIDRIGIKSGDKFVFFSNDMKTYNKFKEALKTDSELKTTRSHELAAASRLRVKLNGSASESVLQAMAMARLRD
jgi:tRNA threonylcarbamoyladenosine modification (KEOPS) complex Cgi121 subunit